MDYDKALEQTDWVDDEEFAHFVEALCLAFDKSYEEVAHDLAQSRFYEGSNMNREAL